MYAYVPVCTCTYWHVLVCTLMNSYILVCTSTYWYILVCTSTYQYILVHTSTYKYVSVRTSTSFSIAALFCGRHDMVQGSTYHYTPYDEMSWYSTYWQIPTCTDIRQVYRILREMAVYWLILTKNEYILVRTSVQVSTRPFLLESYTPGQVGTGWYLSVCTISWHFIIWCVLTCTMSWRPLKKAAMIY
jgi:hypothetical protein